jgi:polysaccharide biosynthesis transport protein
MDTRGREQNLDFGFGGLKYFGLQDYRRMLWRRKWTILSGTLLVALITAVVASFLPNVYRAKTIILVDPRKVPDSFVISTATPSGADRVANLRAEILSDARLSQIIDEMGLYRDLKNKITLEEILLLMRRDISVDVVTTTNGDRGLGAFQISYSSKSPVEAAKVTNQLASLFIKENLEARQEQVLGTAEFIDRELDDAKREMKLKEDKLRDIKASHIGELAESESIHLQAMTSMQLELRSEIDAINRAQQQKVYLQSVMAESIPVVDLDSAGKSSESPGLQAQLAKLQSEQDQLRARYGPGYPDVLKGTVEIEKLKRKIADLDKDSGQMAPAPPPAGHHNPVIESQIAALNEEIEKRDAREKELKTQIAFQQSHLERVPAVEQKLTSINRDYEATQDQYKRLQDRKFAADMSSDLENRQKGERFVVLDPAQPPERPYQPNRPLIDALGLLAGLSLGVLMVLALEVFDPAVKTEQEINEQLNVPVFGEIPWIATEASQRRQVLRTRLAAGGNALLVLAYLAVIVTIGR